MLAKRLSFALAAMPRGEKSMKKTAMIGMALAVAAMRSSAASEPILEIRERPDFGSGGAPPMQRARGIAKGVPPGAYTGGRGPIKRNKSARHHAKRAARISRR